MAYSRTEHLSATAQALSADWTSSAIDVSFHTKGSLQVAWTGVDAFNGTFILEASNVTTPTTDADWAELDGTCVAFDAAAGNKMYSLTDACDFRWLRLNWQANNVTAGTLDYYICLKRDT